MRKLLLFALLLSSTPRLVAQYQPKVKGELIEHTYYSLDYNEEHEQPNWVYYRFTPDMANSAVKRSNKFKADPSVSTGSAALSDYAGSGYDRGHLCPAGDMSFSKVAMEESFYLSNMSPQTPSVNRGVWKSCESFVRELDCDTLYIVTGAIFKDCIGKIGDNEVTVPGHYYKVAYNPTLQRMWAFIIPNTKEDNKLEYYKTTVDKVEELTGIDLYYQLNNKLENRLEKEIF